MSDEHSFLLQRVQPAMVGLIDGSLSTLAPIFGIVFYTHRPHTAFIAGLATSIGAAISMAFSEGLSDTGELTGRGNPALRGSITGVASGTAREISRPSASSALRDRLVAVEACSPPVRFLPSPARHFSERTRPL